MSNYNRVCDSCANGGDCQQPYESHDGTVYQCLEIHNKDGDTRG